VQGVFEQAIASGQDPLALELVLASCQHLFTIAAMPTVV
jgi:hypothetical protein